ncbi:MAG: protein-glutamine glutaminase family protein [Oligoflexales bacterium]
MVKKFQIYAALMSALTVGCGVSNHKGNVAAPKAYVTPTDAHRAYSIVEEIDYLPFEYTADGCYARALYMSMELAAEGIPSSSQFIKATQGVLNFDGTTWTYHVAPALIVSNSPATAPQTEAVLHKKVSRDTVEQVPSEVTIVDPAMSQTPLSLRDWVKKMVRSNNTKAYTVMVPANYYDPYNPPSENMHKNIVRSFEALPKFRLSDIGSACKDMEEKLGDQEQRKAKLRQRTQELIDSLDAVGKLSKDVSFEFVSCL